MKPRIALVLVSLCAWLPLRVPVGEARPAPAEKPVTVVLVRHAETAGSTRTGGDPELSEAGRGRARALARLLAHAGVTRLFSSEYARTRATLAPLAEALDAEVEVVSARDGAEQVERLRALPPGSVAVVAGHSNTVPGLVRALGGEVADLEEGRLRHAEYDRLFLVTLPSGVALPPGDVAVQTLELRYGPAGP